MSTDQLHAAASDEDMQEQSPQAELNQASLHDAASSLQSLHSGIHFEPYAAGDITNARQEEEEEVDADSAGSAHDQLDYTGADAEAMDALLALTSDFSVQSPPKPQNPAGEPELSCLLNKFCFVQSFECKCSTDMPVHTTSLAK
jgi:hypothetical protein